jgi:hypothetical protein
MTLVTVKSNMVEADLGALGHVIVLELEELCESLSRLGRKDPSV